MPDPDPGARLVLATHNQGKLAELRSMIARALPDVDVETAVVDAGTLALPEPVEDGLSFRENALIKARAAAAASGLPAIADDSGLCVDVLGGAPGIFSARWSGRHGDDRANLDLLLAQLADVADPNRTAAFVCAAVLVTPSGLEHVEHGALNGTLLHQPTGDAGFGYDPILQPEGMKLSCAQLTRQEKNSISHRGQAMRQLLPHVVAVLGNRGCHPAQLDARDGSRIEDPPW